MISVREEEVYFFFIFTVNWEIFEFVVLFQRRGLLLCALLLGLLLRLGGRRLLVLLCCLCGHDWKRRCVGVP